MTFERIRPLIVPVAYAAVGVPAVYDPVAASDLVLTWVELDDHQTMLYVTPIRAVEWDRSHPGWRSAAIEEMRSSDAGQVWTHEKRAKDGSLLWVGMMHEDGLGSSRLLLEPELRETFPAGYLVALPDRSCGIAISRTVPDLASLRAMVVDMHADATVPMLPDIREPSALRSSVV
jgi:hypothetical protein